MNPKGLMMPPHTTDSLSFISVDIIYNKIATQKYGRVQNGF